MELSLFAIIVLLVVILYMQSEKFAKVDSEINAVKKKLDLLLERKNEESYIGETNISSEPIKTAKDETRPSSRLIEPTEENYPVTNSEIFDAENNYSPISEQAENPAPSPSPTVKKKRKNINYEKFIGENLFGKIGILVLVIGIGFFVKYAIDKNWINETMRTILGFAVGSLLLFIAERVREKYRTFSSLLAGGAFAIFYLTVAIAFHYYHLFSQATAFVILVSITLTMSILAVLYNRRELAVIALIGGFIAPFLISTGEGNYIILFSYLTILNLGMFGLSLYKKWAELPIISFIATYSIFLLYTLNTYAFAYKPEIEAATQARYLFFFATLFYFIFLLPVLTILKNEGKKLNRWLLSIIIANNFIYLSLGCIFLNNMMLPIKATGIFTLFIAIVNLILVIWLRKSKQDYKFLIYTMLGLVLTFVSITIPIQLDGNYITLFWASEMVLLLWLYVKSRIRVYEYASLILVVLTLISYIMDVEHQWTGFYPSGAIFINSIFATSLFTGLAAGTFALLIAKYRVVLQTAARYLKYTPWNAIMLILSVVILYYTFMIEFYYYLSSDISYKVMQLFTSSCILALCYGFKQRFPIKIYSLYYKMAIGLNVILYIISVWENNDITGFLPTLLPWITTLVVIANLAYVGRLYFSQYENGTRFMVYLSVISTLLWLSIVRLFLHQAELPDEYNAGFSIALAVAGFIQMSLGMRLHQKVLRIVSLVTLGIVLVKLVLVDLWAMPTIGKIVVFIMLGVILLALSFLYQKLKDVLFKNDDEQIN